MKFPRWLETEKSVQRLFELHGFQTQKISICGRQIDLIAFRNDTFGLSEETWIVEITVEKVDADKGGRDYQKLKVAQTEFPNARLMLISLAGFTDDQKATLKKCDVLAITYSEFEARQIRLIQYAQHSIAHLGKPVSPDIGFSENSFVEPLLRIRRRDNSMEDITARDWQQEVLEAKEPQICALLGNLGSGKTSLLQHLMIEGCKKFLDDPDNSVLPIYIPLGRYKQHSGEIEQMLMAELRKSGQTIYPSSLVSHLLETRRSILLLDGLDEVHPIQSSEDVLETVSTILQSLGQSYSAVISCRKQFFQSTSEELAYFGPYTSKALEQLNEGLARILRGHPTTYIAQIEPFNLTRINEYLYKACQMSPAQVSNLFRQFYGFDELSTTPVLLAMIATTFKEKLLDATKLSDFPLLGLYEAYTNRWLERDSKRARLSSSQRKQFSESLAVHMFWHEKDSASWADLKEALRSDPSWGDNPLSDEQAELDIRNSGFLVRELDDKFRFIHRSIMEYFAAKYESERLMAGERLRHYPTDGYRLFLIYQVIRTLHNNDGVYFPAMSWDSTRGSSVLAAQVSMLSAATAEAKTAKPTIVRSIRNGYSSISQTWRNAILEDCSFVYEKGALAFENCQITRCVFIKCNNLVSFNNCVFDSVTISFTDISTPDKSEIVVDAPTASLELPAGVIQMCHYVSQNIKVAIKDRDWVLNMNELSLFADAYSRIREHVRKDNYAKGTRRKILEDFLKSLVRFKYVNEDARDAKVLSLEKKAMQLVGRFRTEPLAAQLEVHNLVKNGNPFPESA